MTEGQSSRHEEIGQSEDDQVALLIGRRDLQQTHCLLTKIFSNGEALLSGLSSLPHKKRKKNCVKVPTAIGLKNRPPSPSSLGRRTGQAVLCTPTLVYPPKRSTWQQVVGFWGWYDSALWTVPTNTSHRVFLFVWGQSMICKMQMHAMLRCSEVVCAYWK